MILKKMLSLFIIFIVAIGAGFFAIDHLRRNVHFSALTSDLAILLYIGLVIIICFVVGRQMLAEEKKDLTLSPGRKMAGKSYAWLNPVEGGNRAGHPLTKALTTIGRDVSCDILINDSTVSRKHAELHAMTGGFMLRDMDSGNGTFVNSQRVQEAMLKNGDQINFGDSRFVFSYDSEKLIMEFDKSESVVIDLDLDMSSLETSIHTATGTQARTVADRGTGSHEKKSGDKDETDDGKGE